MAGLIFNINAEKNKTYFPGLGWKRVGSMTCVCGCVRACVEGRCPQQIQSPGIKQEKVPHIGPAESARLLSSLTFNIFD